MSVEAEVVVIGRARQGKSFLGNCFDPDYDPEDDSEDDEPEQTFKTKEGIESCTSEIKSALFKKVKVPKASETVDLTYTDTPGFPDSDPKKTLEIFDKIVKYINDKRPEAIIWVINPSGRNPEDEKLYNRFSLLMKEFKKTGIFCAVLINNQGSKREFGSKNNKKEKAKSAYDTQISGYGIENFTYEDNIYYSYHYELLKGEVLKIVSRAIVSESSHGKARIFEDIRSEYEGQFDQSALTSKYRDSVNSEIAHLKSGIKWHKSQIEGCSGVLKSEGWNILSTVFTLGVANVVAGGITLYHQEELDDRKKSLKKRKKKLQSCNIEDVMKHAKKEFGEFCTILKALKQTEELEKLKERFPFLTETD